MTGRGSYHVSATRFSRTQVDKNPQVTPKRPTPPAGTEVSVCTDRNLNVFTYRLKNM